MASSGVVQCKRSPEKLCLRISNILTNVKSPRSSCAARTTVSFLLFLWLSPDRLFINLFNLTSSSASHTLPLLQ